MCVDGESFEMFALDSDAENLGQAIEELSTSPEDSTEFDEYQIVPRHLRPFKSWNLQGHEDYADINQWTT